MKTVLFTIAAITLCIVFAGRTRTAAARNKNANLKGQIIAFRSADRVLQVPSSVKNHEVFLFFLSGSGPEPSEHSLLKLVYDHFGYSQFTDELLRKTPMLQVRARRDQSCDESFSSFVSSAPRITDEHSKGQAIEGITYLGKFQKISIPSEQSFRCYVMEHDHFRIETSSEGGSDHVHDPAK